MTTEKIRHIMHFSPLGAKKVLTLRPQICQISKCCHSVNSWRILMIFGLFFFFLHELSISLIKEDKYGFLQELNFWRSFKVTSRSNLNFGKKVAGHIYSTSILFVSDNSVLKSWFNIAFYVVNSSPCK